MAPIQINTVCAEGGDVKIGIALAHHDHPKVCTDGYRAAEEGLHLFRSRVGGDIVIVRLSASEHVADAATCVKRSEAGSLQALDNGAR